MSTKERQEAYRPTKGGTEKAHGAPLGRDEVDQTRLLLGWPYPEFVVPEEIYAAWDATARGQQRANPLLRSPLPPGEG